MRDSKKAELSANAERLAQWCDELYEALRSRAFTAETAARLVIATAPPVAAALVTR